jgi:hypothetical protein
MEVLLLLLFIETVENTNKIVLLKFLSDINMFNRDYKFI